MTRILYWNLNNFSLPKININLPPPANAVNQDRLSYIVDEVIHPLPPPPLPANSPPPPDMIVISEVFSRVREVGLPGGALSSLMNVGLAVRQLLAEIRAAFGPTWCLVPPLHLGNLGLREGVAVYYNAATLRFTGPWVFSYDAAAWIDRGMRPTAATVANPGQYSWWWLQGIPNPALAPPLNLNRNWPVPGIGNVNEWHGAGQWEFRTPAGAVIDFPFPGNRPPFYTRFREVAPPNRTLKVFTVHTSPASAVAATQNIASIQELPVVANTQVGVLLGDFNVDTFAANNHAYNPILGLGYRPLLNWRDAAGNTVPARKPYCMTHLLPVSMATPFNTVGVLPDPQHNVYPRLGYMGSTGPNPAGGPRIPTNTGAIDNVFVSYFPGVVPPAHNTTIVNTVVGKPYTAVPAPPGVPAGLTGGYGYSSTLANPVPPAGVPAAAGVGTFRNWLNYGYIDRTSDHLAILFEV
jgi:hypothetical protein